MVLIRRTAPLASILIGLAGCGPGPEPPGNAPPPPAAELVVDTATVTLPREFPAQLYVEHDAVIAARSAGVIDTLLVDIGARVAAGELLARIESVDQEIAVARAEAAHEASERTVGRARSLSQLRGMTVADSEHAELVFRDATLELRQAKRALELTRITAPFAGVVAARYAGPDHLVAAGDTLFRITETGPLRARIRIPEAAAGPVRLGATASILGVTGSAGTARVIRLAPAVDAASGTREAIVELEAGGGFLPGAAVTVRLGTDRRTVLAAPREAVANDGYVLVSDGGRTTLRAVVLGADLGDGRVEIVAGLRAGERLARPER